MKPKTKPQFTFGIVVTLIISVGLPLAGSVLIQLVDLSNWRWIPVRLHSVVEITGPLIALGVALLLLPRRGAEQGVVHFIWVSSALIAMGLLDGFDSWLQPGSVFVWTDSMALLVGGLLFNLIWLPDNLARTRLARVLPGLVAVAAGVLGVLSVTFSNQLPLLMSGDSFTSAAIAINVLGGLFFVTAGASFVLRYRMQGSKDDLLFANLCFLFGVSGVVFAHSRLWDAAWWYWHLLRLLAYLIVLGYAFSLYS